MLIITLWACGWWSMGYIRGLTEECLPKVDVSHCIKDFFASWRPKGALYIFEIVVLQRLYLVRCLRNQSQSGWTDLNGISKVGWLKNTMASLFLIPTDCTFCVPSCSLYNPWSHVFQQIIYQLSTTSHWCHHTICYWCLTSETPFPTAVYSTIGDVNQHRSIGSIIPLRACFAS